MDGVGDVAASHHAALSKRQAAALGLSAYRRRSLTRASVFREVAPNVLVAHGAPATWRQRLTVATMTGGGSGVISHRSAAALHRLDGMAEGIVEVTTKRGARLLMPGTVQHQSRCLEAIDQVYVDGIRCTTIVRTMVDLPGVVSLRVMERVLDDFERVGGDLDALASAAMRLHRPGQKGTKFILGEVDERQRRGVVRGSWFEKLIEECIRSPKLPAPQSQFEIRSATGDFIARVDLAFPDVRLAIEAHSRKFHTGTHREVIDQRRENRAMLEGWQFLYFGWADRKTPGQARRYLEQLVALRRSEIAARPNLGFTQK